MGVNMKGITEKIMIIALFVGISACKEISVGLDDEAQSALDCIAESDCDDSGGSSESELGTACYFYCDGDFDCGERPKCKGGEDEYGNPITANYCGQSNGTYGRNDDAFACDDTDDSSGSGSSSGTTSGTSTTGTTSSSGTASSGSNTGVDLGDSTGGVHSMPVTQKGGNRFFMGTYSLSSTYSYPYYSCGDSWGNGYEFPGVIRAYSYGSKIDFEDNFGNLVWIANVYPDDTFDFMVQFQDSFGRPSNNVACTCYIEEPYYYQSGTEEISCACDPTYEQDDVCSLSYESM